MSEFAQYLFRIRGTSPSEIPMARLAAYMAELARLMGSEKHVHFEGIRDASVGIVAVADQAYVPIISPRIRRAAQDIEDAEACKPWRDINTMLAEDGLSGEMPLPNRGELIIFPGRTKSYKALPSVTQPTTVQGRIIRIEGAGSEIKIGLEIDGTLSAKVSISSDQASKVAPLFHQYVRLSGDGRWKRNAEGKWVLEHLAATTFERLEDDSLKDVLTRLKRFLPEGSGAAIIEAVEELRRA